MRQLAQFFVVFGMLWSAAEGSAGGLPGTTSSGRQAIGGPAWVRPAQFPPNWKELHPEWLTEEGEFFHRWHIGGMHFSKKPGLPPINPGTVGPPNTTPGTPGPGVIRRR